MSDNRIKDLAAKLAELEKQRKALWEEARQERLDPAALKRAAGWTEAMERRRRVQAAIDHQTLYRLGKVPKPATIPPNTDLSRVAALTHEGKTVREIGKALGISKSQAGKLQQLARLFDVPVHSAVDKAVSESAADDLEIPEHLRR